MSNSYGTRDDCIRDDQPTVLPAVSRLGHNTHLAKRGSWIVYDEGGPHAARVVGRVHCEGITYLEVIATDTALTMAFVRWVNPASVRECYDSPHQRVVRFLFGTWTDADTILRTANNGLVRDDTAQ